MTGRLAADTAETTIPHLSAERFRVMLFPFPPRAEQEEIAQLLRSQSSAIRALDNRFSVVRNLSRRVAHDFVIEQ
jgi:restriction endonuclease S subunit